MATREEIREGIALRLHTQERSLLRIVDETSPCNCVWEELSEHFKNQYRKTADLFMGYLHDNDVVIKVDGELPHVEDGKWHYVVEPLVEGE